MKPFLIQPLTSSGLSRPSDNSGISQSGGTPSSRTDLAWLAGLSSTLFLILLSSSSYVASLPFIRVEWGLNNTQAGVIFSSYLAGYAVSSLLLVPFTDRFDPFRILVFGVVLTACSGFLFPVLAQGLWTACLLRFVYGVGHVCVYITGIRLASQRFAHRGRATAVSVFVGSGYAGTTVSYVFMGILLERLDGWEPAFLVTTLPGLASIVTAAFLASGRSARSDWPAGLAGSARSARPTGLARSARSARTVELAGSARSARTVELAGSARSERSARSTNKEDGGGNGGWLSLAPLRDRRLMLVILA